LTSSYTTLYNALRTHGLSPTLFAELLALWLGAKAALEFTLKAVLKVAPARSRPWPADKSPTGRFFRDGSSHGILSHNGQDDLNSSIGYTEARDARVDIS